LVGRIEVGCEPSLSALMLTLNIPALPLVPQIIARVRRVFDLGADPVAISVALGEDLVLRDLAARRPGVRVAGSWDLGESETTGPHDLSVADLSASLSRLLARPVGAGEAAARRDRWRPWQAYAQRLIDLANADSETTGGSRHAFEARSSSVSHW
jgi:3-methyladenine DNA glycosylase/8-oxoguanine DNA glycosylase